MKFSKNGYLRVLIEMIGFGSNLMVFAQRAAAVGLMVMFTSCGYLKNEQNTEQLALLNSIDEAFEARSATDAETLSAVEGIRQHQQALVEQVVELEKQMKALHAKAQFDQGPPKANLKSKPEVLKTGSILDGKTLLGRVEWLWLPGAQRYFAGQINTALDESLIYADDIMRFEREGEPWLSFNVERLDWPSRIEAKISAHKRFSYPGASSVAKVPVVSIPIELSNYNDSIEFLVIERKKAYPQFVIGRNFLTDIAVVDVSEKYVVSREPERVKRESAAAKVYRKQLASKKTASRSRSAADSVDSIVQSTKDQGTSSQGENE